MKMIRSITLLMLSAFLFVGWAPKEEDNKGIAFYHGSLEEALQKAKDQGKYVFMDAYASWCGPCKMMSRNVFSQDKVGAFFNKNFVNVKVDMEKGEGRALSKKYRVSAYPTLFILNPEGVVVDMVVGYQNKSRLIQFGKRNLPKASKE